MRRGTGWGNSEINGKATVDDHMRHGGGWGNSELNGTAKSRIT